MYPWGFLSRVRGLCVGRKSCVCGWSGVVSELDVDALRARSYNRKDGSAAWSDIAALCDEVVRLRGELKSFPCDGGCSYGDGPVEDCSRHGRTPKELWEIVASDHEDYVAEVKRFGAVILAVEKALRGHPECDKYAPDDVISCGWKRAVVDVRRALDAADE